MTVSINSAFKKRPTTKATAALAAATILIAGGATGLAAWTQTQEFSGELTAKSLGMEYSVDSGTTWNAFAGTVTLPAIADVDDTAPDVTYELQFRNNGSDDVTISTLQVVPAGSLFEGDYAATVAWGSADNTDKTAKGGESSTTLPNSDVSTVLQPEDVSVQYLNLAFSDNMDESYSGSTGSILVTATFDQN